MVVEGRRSYGGGGRGVRWLFFLLAPMLFLPASFACFFFLDGLGGIVEVPANKNPGFSREKYLECINFYRGGHQSVASYSLAV